MLFRSVQWSALGPLVAYRSTPEEREILVRPLFRVRTRRDRRDLRADILYPLATAEVRDEEWSARLLLLAPGGRSAVRGPAGSLPRGRGCCGC